MRFCQSHWDALRAAIRDRGLERFVAPTGEEAARRTVDGTSPRDSFGPLMGAHLAIVHNLADAYGIGMLQTEGCPLCLAIERCSCGDPKTCELQTWIDRAADDARTGAVELGLVGAT